MGWFFALRNFKYFSIFYFRISTSSRDSLLSSAYCIKISFFPYTSRIILRGGKSTLRISEIVMNHSYLSNLPCLQVVTYWTVITVESWLELASHIWATRRSIIINPITFTYYCKTNNIISSIIYTNHDRYISNSSSILFNQIQQYI